jgi:hypothetical protein
MRPDPKGAQLLSLRTLARFARKAAEHAHKTRTAPAAARRVSPSFACNGAALRRHL